MTQLIEFRELAKIDPHHGSLRNISDAGLLRLALDIQYDDRGQPIVAVALKEEICPADPTADYRIKYWLGKTEEDLVAALTQSSLAVIEEMKRRGKGKIWGAVPKNASHLLSFLDRVVAAGQCTRIDGSLVSDGFDGSYESFVFYIAHRNEAEVFMQRAP